MYVLWGPLNDRNRTSRFCAPFLKFRIKAKWPRRNARERRFRNSFPPKFASSPPRASHCHLFQTLQPRSEFSFSPRQQTSSCHYYGRCTRARNAYGDENTVISQPPASFSSARPVPSQRQPRAPSPAARAPRPPVALLRSFPAP